MTLIGTITDQTMESEVVEDKYEERIEVLEEGAVAAEPYHYSRNQAFDDLMDVLRDDQGTKNFIHYYYLRKTNVKTVRFF